MKTLLRSLLMIIHVFVGIGALFGGLLGILSPDGSVVGLSATEALAHGPFTSFLIPGIFLFVVIGLGNIAGGITAKLKHPYQGYISGCLGGIMCLWILIQCYMLWAWSVLHILFFFIGVVQLVMAIILSFKTRLFPTELVIRLLLKEERD
ncbi:MAG: hypothetical protein ACOWWR_05045 [Eubacteriales bacterium]